MQNAHQWQSAHMTQRHMSMCEDDSSNNVKFGASGKAMEFNTNNYAVC